ncbi:MAG: hypothetical protein IIZ09_09395 [Ruminococcus sp.]|nr:hypothetical protein [Ruminococcus sp.]
MLRHRPNSIVSLGDGTEAYMELNADSAADLATTYEDYDIAAGSICLDISTGDFYVLDGSGAWINQTGENAVGTASVLSTAAIKKESLTYAPSEPADKQEVNADADVLGDTDSGAK